MLEKNSSKMSGIFILLFIGFSAAQSYSPYYDNLQNEYRNRPNYVDKKQSGRQNLCPIVVPISSSDQPTLPIGQTNEAAKPAYIPEPSINNRNSIDDATGNAITQSPFENFNAKLYQAIAPAQPLVNLVYSPISLQTLLAFVYTGSQGSTSSELRRALALPEDKTNVGSLFQQLLRSQKSTTSDAQLIMANKMYYDSKLRVKGDFRKRAQDQFDAEVEDTRFDFPAEAATNINRWIAGKTENHIQNLISAYTLDANTQSILVNAIYFKAKWQNEFSMSDTAPQHFQSSRKSPPVPVDMMYNDDFYRYADFPELKAKILEMPYNNSELSMMIILPDDIEGLQAVEEKLQNRDLTELSSRLKRQAVVLRLPKFRVEYELDMVEPLMKLGVKELFTSNANLDDFFENNQRMSVSKVQHKAFIDVNEAGSEAAAASFVKIIPLSLPGNLIYFTVDHPFIFAIRGPQAVYFIGHVVKF